jgi:hypothetical protein
VRAGRRAGAWADRMDAPAETSATHKPQRVIDLQAKPDDHRPAELYPTGGQTGVRRGSDQAARSSTSLLQRRMLSHAKPYAASSGETTLRGVDGEEIFTWLQPLYWKREAIVDTAIRRELIGTQ